MPKVVISGYYGFGNWGDEAILESAASGLTKAIRGLEVVVLSHDPRRTLARHGLRAVHRTNPAAVLRELRSADLLVSGGGSILQDVTSSRSLWYYLAVICLAQRLGTRVMLYANGLGPINRSCNRLLSRWVLDRVSLITVRGPSSKEFLDELGVKRPRVVVTADSAFSIRSAPPEKVTSICAKEKLPDLADPRKGPFVGIAVRPWRGSENLEGAIARAADYVVEELGYSVVFLPVHRDLDLPTIERVRAAMSGRSHILRGSYAAEETVGLFGRFRWVLSMRLHPLIFAAVAGVPALGLVYDPKVQEFLTQTQQEPVGPVERATLEDILLAITRLEADYARRGKLLNRVVEELREKAALNNTLAADLLRGGGPPATTGADAGGVS